MAGLIHIQDYVATTDKFTFDEDLWNGGPFGEEFNLGADVLVIQDVNGRETGKTLVFQYFTDSPAESALEEDKYKSYVLFTMGALAVPFMKTTTSFPFTVYKYTREFRWWEDTFSINFLASSE